MSSIRLDTPRKAYEYAHHIAAGCDDCHRWREFTLDELDRLGAADRPITSVRFRCSGCGERAGVQLRPQAPTLEKLYLG